MIECDPSAIDLAETGAVAGNFRHQRCFAETHFPETLGEAVITVNHTNPAGCANRELAEWEKEWAGEGHVVET